MFNIPKNADFGEDFNEAELEKELHAILSGNQASKPSRTSNNNAKQERVSQAANNVPARKQNEPTVQNPYDLNALMGNLNLENADDDEDFDENDPELKAQLAALLGEDLPSYSPPKPTNQPMHQSVIQPVNQSVKQSPHSSSAVTKPSRPAPIPVERPVSQPTGGSCIQLDNSHFVTKPPQQQPSEQQPISQTKNVPIEQLIRQRDEYKALALNAKKQNDIENAKLYLKKYREMETALEPMTGGQTVSGGQTASVPTTNNVSSKTTEEPKQAGSLAEELEQRRQKIEQAMQKEQAMNNVPKVKMMTRVIKQYDSAIKAAKAGRQFDYASLPPAPGFGELQPERFGKSGGQSAQSEPSRPAGQTTQAPQSNHSVQPTQSNTQSNIQSNLQPNSQANKIRQLEKQRDEYKMLALNAKKQNDIENAKIYLLKMKELNALIERGGQQTNAVEPDKAAPAPVAQSRSILEELKARKEKFESVLQRENAQSNASRVRVISRVLKLYESAMAACKAGREFDYESLPIPPGFEELPKGESTKKELPPTKTAPQPPQKQANEKPPFKRAPSVNNRQLDYLLQRQKLFKEAAVASNKKGDTSQALDYFRKAKGFAPLITAVENGLPIDVSNIPIPPQLDTDDFVMVTSESSGALSGVDLEREEHYRKLELELEKQIGLCAKNKDHFYQIGDVSTGSKFEKYLVDMKKDFEFLQAVKKRGDEVPKYRYERKSFSIVVCNADVSINECVVEVMRGIDLPCKTPVDSYVRFEFPFPKDTPVPAKTHSFKNSLYPEFNQTFRFTIDRKSRSLARLFNKTMKFEIFTKGGLFRSDELIGYISVDLKVLLNKCSIFESFPILNGRKEVGGKLCIQIKLREPLLAKQVEEIREKWLVFD